MIVKKAGGMMEFIPTPKEKREGVLRDHTLNLLANVDRRLRRIEEAAGTAPDDAEAFTRTMAAIRNEETQNQTLFNQILPVPRMSAASVLPTPVENIPNAPEVQLWLSVPIRTDPGRLNPSSASATWHTPLYRSVPTS